MNVTGGSTDVTTYFTLRLTATGVEATALDVTTFDLQSVRSGAAPAAKVDATALAATDSTHADNKAIEVDATNQPGLYRVDWADAPFAAGVREVILTVKCATCFTEHLRVSIDAPVNVTSIIADQQSATDLKDFADAGYDPATNKVQGVVLVDTTTDVTTKTGYRLSSSGVIDIVQYDVTTIAQPDALSARINAIGATVAAVKADTAAILDDTGTSGVVVVISAANANKIADHVRRRTQANVEASADGDALSVGSEYGFIQQAQKSGPISGTTLPIFKTTGASLGNLTIVVSTGASPVTGVS